MQGELEWLLYNHEHTTGAMYRLLKRSGENLDSEPLVLRSSSVGKGVVTAAEWDVVSKVMLPNARVVTLVPLDLAAAAMTLYGKTPTTKAIMAALSKLPDGWSSEEEDEDEAQDDEEGEEDGEEGGEEGSSEKEEDGESEEEQEEPDGDTEEGEEEPAGGTEEEDGAGPSSKVAKYALDPVPPQIESELQAYARFRTAPLSTLRRGAACVEVTTGNDRSNLLRFFGYLSVEKGIKVTSLVHILASPRLALAAKQYVEHMVKHRGLRYGSAAKYVLSISCVARFAYEMVKQAGNASQLDSSVLVSLSTLHQQCIAESAKRDAFRQTPVNWLEWRECQLARVHAERIAGAADADLGALHDACLLALLTYQPPDRVGVIRTLRLGHNLLPATNGYQLNVASPIAHKTAAVFGPTKTTMPAAIGVRITAYVAAANLEYGDYLFYAGEDASRPLEPFAWTRLVKNCFKRHSERKVPLAPKELRASFVTFLKGNDHSDTVLRAAATAMRHSSKTQASHAYNKGDNQTIAAAVKVAEAYAARFSAAASSSSAA